MGDVRLTGPELADRTVGEPHPNALARGALVQDLRVQTEHLLDVDHRQTLKDSAHRGDVALPLLRGSTSRPKEGR